MMKKALVAGGFAAVMACHPVANAEFVSLGAKVGTLGLGIEATRSLSESFDARLGLNTFSYGHDVTESGIAYDLDLDLQSVSLLADWRPMKSGFRVTAGALYNNNELNGRAKAQGSYNIGGQTFSAEQVGTIDANVSFDNFAPYLGIGWTSTPSEKSPWSYAFDLGVLYQGSPAARLTSTGGTASEDPTFQSYLRAEERDLQDGIDDFKYFPVVSVGLNYRF